MCALVDLLIFSLLSQHFVLGFYFFNLYVVLTVFFFLICMLFYFFYFYSCFHFVCWFVVFLVGKILHFALFRLFVTALAGEQIF